MDSPDEQPSVVLTIGETMALLDCNAPGRPNYGSSVSLRMAGAESNTAIGLQRQGIPTRWISRVGSDVLGDMIVEAATLEGVDTSGVTRDQTRSTGIFMKWRSGGNTEREYFRRNSAAAALAVNDLADEPRADVSWLHVTGITLALSQSCAELVTFAARRAFNRGIEVSFDLNYRAALWESPAMAAAAVREVLPYTTWALCGAEEGEALFGVADPKLLGRELRTAGAKNAIVRVGVAGAWLIDDEAQLIPIEALESTVVDEIGAGDAFGAGFIAGMLTGRGAVASVKLAHALAARALRGTGDWETLPRAGELT